MFSSYTIIVYFKRENYFLLKHNYKVIWTATNFHKSTYEESVPVITEDKFNYIDRLNSQMHISTNVRTGDSSLLKKASSSLHMTSSFLMLTSHPGLLLIQDSSYWVEDAQVHVFFYQDFLKGSIQICIWH